MVADVYRAKKEGPQFSKNWDRGAPSFDYTVNVGTHCGLDKMVCWPWL